MSMETSQTAQGSHPKEETKMEKQSVRGAMCELAEDVINRRAEDNDASLIDAIIHDPHSDFVCIPASYLASLPEIVSFVPALDAVQREKFLVNVLSELSEHLKTIKDKEGKVTIRTEYKRNPRNTLLMHSVPADAKEEDLLELFRSIPTAASVSFKMDVNSCWLATFDTEANAVATHSALSKQKLMVKGKPISVGLRATRFIRVSPAAPVPAQQQPAPAGFNMRQGMPAAMRQQYAMQQYYMQSVPQFYMQQYYAAMQQPRGGQHQPGWNPQQKQRTSRGGGRQHYQNTAHQQQRTGGAQEQVAATPAAATTASTAAPAAAAPQQQQQQREGQQRQGQGRGGRNYRGRNRGAGGNRGHGSQSSAAESSSTEGAPKEHRQRQSAASERQEQSKPQEKPTADSFPPLM